MGNELTISNDLFEIYQKIGQDPQLLLKNYARDVVISKLQKYQAESAQLETKYGMPFAAFKEKVENMKDSEDFQWEDDLMDWEFAVENIKYWNQILEMLNRV